MSSARNRRIHAGKPKKERPVAQTVFVHRALPGRVAPSMSAREIFALTSEMRYNNSISKEPLPPLRNVITEEGYV